MPPPPFWMTKNHFRSHFLPFQINTQLFFIVFFSQNDCRRPSWMTENHFRWHFSPFQNNAQLFFFRKRLPATIFDDRKSLLIAFLAISDQYATLIFLIFFHKMAAAILGDRKSLLIVFLAISDKYATFFFFTKCEIYFG